MPSCAIVRFSQIWCKLELGIWWAMCMCTMYMHILYTWPYTVFPGL